MVMLSLPILTVMTSFSSIPALMPGFLRCSDCSFGCGNRVILEHGVLVPPLEELVNSYGGMQ